MIRFRFIYAKKNFCLIRFKLVKRRTQFLQLKMYCYKNIFPPLSKQFWVSIGKKPAPGDRESDDEITKHICSFFSYFIFWLCFRIKTERTTGAPVKRRAGRPFINFNNTLLKIRFFSELSNTVYLSKLVNICFYYF